MKPILTAFFKEKILTVQYQDLSFTDYYLDGTTWRKMPGMRTVSMTQLEEITQAMEIVSKKRIANAKRREARQRAPIGIITIPNETTNRLRDGSWPIADKQAPLQDRSQTKQNSVLSRVGGWVRSFFRFT
jgi:hypothetical protein